MWPAFFIRVSPASRNAKPACMNITRIAATTTHTVLVTISVSSLMADLPTPNASTGQCRRPSGQSPHGLKMTSQATSSNLHLLELHARPVVGDVRDRRRPNDSVTGLVAAASRIDERVDDGLRLLLGDDEREHCLREEARLEHAPPVLVSDPPLAPVADRLDHRHAAFANHDRLDLDHADLRSIRTTSRQTPWCWPRRSRVPTTRNPHRSCSASEASFSGKIPVWIVQIPLRSARAINSSRSAFPTPRPCAESAT